MKNADTNKYAENGAVLPPGGPPKTIDGMTEEMRARHAHVVERAEAIASERGWTRAELGRQAGLPSSTLSQVLDGTYQGLYANQIKRLETWLASVDEIRERVVGITDAPGYYETPTARELTDTLLYAQQMPQMAVVTLAAGMGKTTVARAFSARPGVYRVTMRPTTSGAHRMLQEIATAIDCAERSVNRLDRAIGMKIRRNGRQTLLIVDEAQYLTDQAVDQLRYFYDEYACGIALLGNEEIYSRFGRGDPREGFGQIHRRIGKRMRRMKPQAGDIEATIDAWEIEDPEARQLLRAVGHKPGTLGQIAQTARLARILAAGDGEPLGIKHVRAAWENRGGEEVRT